MQDISSYKNVRSVNSQERIDILDALNRIKNGINKEPIIEARAAIAAGNKTEYDNIKATLPTFRFSALFTGSKRADAEAHTGFICLDFDKFEDLDEMHKKIVALKDDPYTFAIWLSPSAEGFKLLVRIPKSLDHHKYYFDALATYYSMDEWDQSTSDITRHCFHSYDPDLFINEGSTEWTEMVDPTENTVQPNPVHSVIEKDQDKVLEKILKWFAPKFDPSSRNTSLYKLAAACNRYGIAQDTALYTMKRVYGLVGGADGKLMSDGEFDRIVKNGYADASVNGTASFEDSAVLAKTRRQLKMLERKSTIAKKLMSEGKTEEEAFAILEEAEYAKKVEHEFWTCTTGRNGEEKLEIAPLRFKKFLADNGFFIYHRSELEYIFVQVCGRFVSETNEDLVKGFVLNWAEKNNPVLYDFIAKDTAKFDKRFLNLMQVIEVEFIKDTDTSAMLFFDNKLVEITKDEIIEKDYLDFSQYIWKSQIIKRDYTRGDDDCDFKTFVRDISGADEHGMHTTKNFNKNRYDAFRSTIGYLMHTYKRMDRSPAVVLYDEESSENQVSGGTGKGILGKAISQFKDFVTLDGKAFDSSKDFAWQRIDQSTQVALLDDVGKKFSFENIFSAITNGMTVNQKNKPAFYIPSEEAPKIMISSNYIMAGEGSSHDRRRRELELYNYYSSDYTPAERFGKMMFVGWDDKEYNAFNNFMINCVQFYLMNGLTEYKSISIKERRLTSAVSDVIMEWAEDYYKEEEKRNVLIPFKDLFSVFYKEAEHGWKQHMFTKKLIKLANHWRDTKKFGIHKVEILKLHGYNAIRLVSDKKEEDLPF